MSAVFGVITAAVKRLNITAPTLIQQRAIPLIENKLKEGNNTSIVVLHAPPGSGKTIAFAAPLAIYRSAKSPKALVVVPSQNLALQLWTTMQQLTDPDPADGPQTSNKIVLLDTRHSAEENRKQLSGDVWAVIGTPKAIAGMLEHNANSKSFLKSLKCVVADEVDHLLAPESRYSLKRSRPSKKAVGARELLSKINSSSRPLFICASATINNPTRKTLEFLLNAEVEMISGYKPEVEATLRQLTHQYCVMELSAELPAVANLILALKKRDGMNTNTLVVMPCSYPLFRLCYALGDVGLPSTSIGPDALAAFTPTMNVLVTNHALARGLHLDGVDHVYIFHTPCDTPTVNDVSIYVHTAGRTGRGNRTSGTVTSVITRRDVPALLGVGASLKLDFAMVPPPQYSNEAAPKQAAKATPGNKVVERKAKTTKSQEEEEVILPIASAVHPAEEEPPRKLRASERRKEKPARQPKVEIEGKPERETGRAEAKPAPSKRRRQSDELVIEEKSEYTSDEWDSENEVEVLDPWEKKAAVATQGVPKRWGQGRGRPEDEPRTRPVNQVRPRDDGARPVRREGEEAPPRRNSYSNNNGYNKSYNSNANQRSGPRDESAGNRRPNFAARPERSGERQEWRDRTGDSERPNNRPSPRQRGDGQQGSSRPAERTWNNNRSGEKTWSNSGRSGETKWNNNSRPGEKTWGNNSRPAERTWNNSSNSNSNRSGEKTWSNSGRSGETTWNSDSRPARRNHNPKAPPRDRKIGVRKSIRKPAATYRRS